MSTSNYSKLVVAPAPISQNVNILSVQPFDITGVVSSSIDSIEFSTDLKNINASNININNLNGISANTIQYLANVDHDIQNQINTLNEKLNNVATVSSTNASFYTTSMTNACIGSLSGTNASFYTVS